MRLDPSGEQLPDGGVRKREVQESHTNHQSAAQRCGAVQFVRGPQIIECQQKQEAVGGKQCGKNPLVEEEEVEAGERGPSRETVAIKMNRLWASGWESTPRPSTSFRSAK